MQHCAWIMSAQRLTCDIYIDTTDINAMLNVVCTEWPSCFLCLYWLYYYMEMHVKMCTSCTNKDIYITRHCQTLQII